MRILQEAQVAGATVRVVEGDLTAQEVDAIVNAANVHLRHGGGVAGAIVRAGGPVIQVESDAWVDRHGSLDEGQAAVTSAGSLPSRWVIHTAGPVFDPSSAANEPRLRSAVRAALAAAVEHEATSVAMPAISAGIYGYPPDEATAILADEAVAFAREHDLEEIRLVALDHEMAERFTSGLRGAVGG